MTHSSVNFHFPCQFCQQDVLFLDVRNTGTAITSPIELYEYVCVPCQTYYSFADDSKKPYLITMAAEKDNTNFTLNWFLELGTFTLCNEAKIILQIYDLPNITPANKLEKLQTLLVFS